MRRAGAADRRRSGAGLVGTATFYGAGPEELLDSLRPAFERVSPLFADITWRTVLSGG